MQNSAQKRVVITGMGTINPIAASVPEFWDNLIAGKNGVRTLKYTDTSILPVKIGGEVDLPENIGDYLPKKKVNRFERFIVFARIAAVQAFRDSGILREDVDSAPYRYGAIIGTGDGGNAGHYKSCQSIDKHNSVEFVSPFYVVSVIPNTPPAYFAKDYNFQGPNFSVNSACATSNHAIGIAAAMIKAGTADVMMAGGCESCLNMSGLSGFSAIGALSRRNDSPETASRPFDKNRDGFVLAEGAGVVCLEELEHAKKRGARIYAELSGYGLSCDAFDLVAPHPDGRGIAMSVNMALESAGLSASDIDLVNAHGTSTNIGDLAETTTLRRLFGAEADRIMVHSTKSMVGHLIGAAGGVEAIAAILALCKGIVHPSINIFERDPKIDLNIVTETRECAVRHVLSNGFGFGGQNSSIILSQFKG
ncbi:MAG: beta-ketoacyl-[acyl-carrier-protein] synthase family protein [Spirochaetota bacterium]|jgi:3-oxoacyl-[acyl-carrier-protein] synthase II|nr:beta-ketoacyl-[acyl-carrier-protein] synthase family protein [Spirochaetota bacterium]